MAKSQGLSKRRLLACNPPNELIERRRIFLAEVDPCIILQIIRQFWRFRSIGKQHRYQRTAFLYRLFQCSAELDILPGTLSASAYKYRHALAPLDMLLQLGNPWNPRPQLPLIE